MKLSLPVIFQVFGTLLAAQAVVSQETMNIAEIAASLPDFSTLVGFVTVENSAIQPILARLTGDVPTTVFAPTNDAFAALPPSTVAFLQANPEVLAEVLLYHAVDGAVPSSAIGANPISVPTLLARAEVVATRHVATSWCWFFSSDCMDTVTINDATVVIPDVPASNGVIHAIDKVLIPPGLPPLLDLVDTAIDQHLDTLVAAVSAANLVDVLRGPGPFTVFAPSEEAWQTLPAGLLNTLLKPENVDLLTDILLYHVFSGAAVDSSSISPGQDITMVNEDEVRLNIDGGNVLVNDATVVAADVGTINGIVHVIDKILIPPEMKLPQDIVDIALLDSELTSLVAALVEADLVGALDTAGPYTVLAPTNAAFEALGDVSLDKHTLQNILSYHVIPGSVFAKTVVTLKSATTLNGQSVPIEVRENGDIFVGDAKVIATDIAASNGVIHKIDAVLIPPEMEEECPYFDWICDFFSWLYV